jgi:glyoxylase-like metal-dependent hydrolase (beta-lactamase superfamily II)
MKSLHIGHIKITWLEGGITWFDGGAMFGVVPKSLWSKRISCNEQNLIKQPTSPLLVQSKTKNILIDSGLGVNRLSAKFKRNYQALEEVQLEHQLMRLGISPQDIDMVLLTHMHFDHVSGLSKMSDRGLVSSFPQAEIIVSDLEWREMREPNSRSKNTYLRDNWEAIEAQIKPFSEQYQVTEEIQMIRTGGHSQGHSLILFDSEEEKGVHFGDNMPTHAHLNPLWVTAFDDYPIDTIKTKEAWLPVVLDESWWVTFYHDTLYYAVKWNKEKEIVSALKRD